MYWAFYWETAGTTTSQPKCGILMKHRGEPAQNSAWIYTLLTPMEAKKLFSSHSDRKTEFSNVIFNSIYTAEHQNARLKQAGWNAPGFDDSKWKDAFPVRAPSNNVVAQVLQPIRNTKKIIPVQFEKFSNTHYLFDLGRNIYENWDILCRPRFIHES